MTAPPPPYPADTRAKGWRFELDLERIRQSDTWALAPADVRPWLLMLWAVAWEQSPCGSLPADHGLIAARIGIAPKAFERCRSVLMRGWAEADDGRLYHATVTERVLEMVAYRTAAAKRKEDYRARMAESRASHAGVPGDEPVRPASVPRDSAVQNDTGTGTGTGRREEEQKTTPPPSAGPPLAGAKARALRNCPETFLVTGEWQRWARENAPLVDIRAETAIFRGTERKTGITDWPKAWRVWMLREQKRLAEVAARDAKRAGAPGESTYRREKRERAEELSAGLVSAKPPGYKPAAPLAEVIEGAPNAAIAEH